MLKKVRLKEKDDYQALFVASRVAPMLEALLEGRPGPAAVGSEHGGIACWDDVVVMDADRALSHVQLKRQTTPFSTKPIARPTTATDLSELDETLASLADWSADAANLVSKRDFELAVLAPTVDIKKELPIRWLEHLCNDCRKDGIDASELKKRTDGPTLKVFEWLTTWCRFTDWNHVATALSRVSVTYPGNEATLRAQIRESLSRNFKDPNRAIDLLVAYVAREGIDVTAITAENVFAYLHDLVHPELITWTQYQLEGAVNGWSVCGTNAIPANDDESPPLVVAKLWAASANARKLRVFAACQHNDANPQSLPGALIRLALHVQGPSQAFISNHGEWQARARYELGHTLGLGDDDFDSLCWAANDHVMAPSRQRIIAGAAAIREEAIALSKAMDDVTWQQVMHKMEDRLACIRDADLNFEMRKLWEALRQSLSDNATYRATLFSKMMYPPGEAMSRERALRVGPRATVLITNALILHILVAVGLGCNSVTGENLEDVGQVQVIATKRWSGPKGNEPADLDSHGLTALLANDITPIVILSGVSASPLDFLGTDLFSDGTFSTSMAAEVTPRLLVTKSGVVGRLLSSGTLESVRQHFSSALKKSVDAKDDAARFETGG